MIVVERVDAPEALVRLAPEWDALASRAPQRCLFASATWLSLWWRHFGDPLQLYVLAARERGELVGVAPLVLARRRWHGLPVRELGFAINGCAQRSDLLVADRCADVYAALASAIADCAREWDVARLDGMSESGGAWTGLAPALAARGVRGPAPWIWRNLALDLGGDFDAWIAARPRHFRKNLRQSQTALRKLGEPALERHSEPCALDAALSRLLAIERRSWKLREGEAVATRADFEAFYRDVAAVYGPVGACQVRILTVGGHDVAANLVVLDGRVAHGLRTCYDEAFAQASPGRNLMEALVRDLSQSGVHRLELDRHTAFLAQWATRADSCLTATLFHRRPRSRALAWLKRGAETARSLTARLSPPSADPA